MNKTNNISSFTLIVTFICISLVGIALIPLLPVKLSPSYTLPALTVNFNMPGNSARNIEMEVSSKLESMLTRIKGVKNINSNSGNGWGRISIELDKHTNIDAARFEASTIIRQTWAQLPEGVSYPYIETNRSDNNSSRPFMTFTLNAPSTPIYIQRYAEEYIKPRLARLQGIYKIKISGATPMEWRLEYDNEQLNRVGITTNDIQTSIQRHYKKEFLGTCNIEKAGTQKEWIRLALIPEDQSENMKFNPAIIQVSNKNGKIIYLDKLVKVTHEEAAPQSYYRINGLNTIYLSITAEETANQLNLSKQIKKEIQKTEQILPQGYEIHSSYDATEYIHNELNKIYFRTGLTVLILLLFVLIITLNPRYLFLIVTSLTVNMAIAIIFYYLFKLEMQLYSLAGITISLNLIIDNTIVMTDHILHRRNLKAFLSILAATLTTMGALVIIFFLDEKIRLNLQDFAAVVIINLMVSLFIALFFVPSLIDKIGLKNRQKKKKRTLQKRLIIYFNRSYLKAIRFLCRWRIAFCFLLLLAFGIPTFLLPEKIEKKGKGAELYNNTIGSYTYKEHLKPVIDKVLGGSLRLFVQKVYEGSYFTRNEEVVLYANATLPNGSTLEQMNNLIKRMEVYLSQFKEIKQFQTTIHSARQANISITFLKEQQRSGFPYILKSNMISKALELGGGSWGIYGLEDQGFSNDVREGAGSFRIKMYGYNYDELFEHAERLKNKLLEHKRIKEVTINSDFSWYKDDYQEFYFDLNKKRMIEENISPYHLFATIHPVLGKDINCGSILVDNNMEQIKLSSRQSTDYDIWALENKPYLINGKLFKLSDIVSIKKEQAPQQIAKENQQYRLCLQYEYIGAAMQGSKLLKKDLEEFNKTLPMGYTAESQEYNWHWGEKDYKQYLLLLLVIGIIFFTTSILFNSLRQPLAIIFIIPVSYIGVFLTFYWFGLNFDQGGFASFILLCGITVNASIYIINEYNAIRKQFPLRSPAKSYIKAWNRKILPIFLTVVSTILGFIPFMVGNEKEGFWFPLSAGTIGGLIMSIVGIFIFLPIFTLKKRVT